MREKIDKFCFGQLCYIVKDNIHHLGVLDYKCIGKTQADVIYLMYYIGTGNENMYAQLDGGYPSKIFNAQNPLPQEYIKDICTPEKEYDCLKRIKRIFSTDILEKKSLIKDLIYATHNIEQFYQSNDKDLSNANVDEQSYFFLKCLQLAVKSSNNYNSKKTKEDRKRMIAKYNLESGDPFGINKKSSESSAIVIRVMGDDIKESPYNEESGIKLFHHFESCLEFIIQEDFIILNIRVIAKTVEIIVCKSGYKLKKLKKEQYQDALKLLEPCMEDFKPKVSWKGMNIVQLAANGFNNYIWIPYGYYDGEKLIAICDYKIRLDRDIEIGIMCVDENYRGEDIAKSFLYFFRLKFFALRLFSGTYNGNNGMIKAFEGTGFKPLVFKKDADNVVKGTNIRYDRVEKDKYYSVYFIAEPLWKETKSYN